MKLLICDKDGTLTRPKSGQTFVQHPEDQELIEGVADAIARYIADGWTIAIASNQGGVAAGFKTLEDAQDEMRYALSLLPEIEYAVFCPDNGDTAHLVSIAGGCNRYRKYQRISVEGLSYRKPSAGLIKICLAQTVFPYSDILFVGDRPEDQGAAANAKVNFMWADEWRK